MDGLWSWGVLFQFITGFERVDLRDYYLAPRYEGMTSPVLLCPCGKNINQQFFTITEYLDVLPMRKDKGCSQTNNNMAKQSGIFQVEGTLGNVTFVKTQDGYLVKTKSEISKARRASDPAFQRTRENNSEFGRAGKASQVLRTAVRNLSKTAKDNRLASRLTKEMMKVLKADATSIRGMRNVVDGEAEMLKGFEFNINAQLSTTLFAKYESTIDRVTGMLDVTIPSFVPINDLVVPDGSTHFSIVSGGSAVDFEAQTFEETTSTSAIIPIDATPTAAQTLSNAITPASTHPLFLLLGVQFYQFVNGINYPLKNGAFNALQIVEVRG